MNWSALRVFNDDIVQGGADSISIRIRTWRSSPTSSPASSSIAIAGQPAREQSRRSAGDVGGTGIVHAESNPSPSEPMRLLQFWILPRHKNLPPRWEQKAYTREDRHNRLFPVVRLMMRSLMVR